MGSLIPKIGFIDSSGPSLPDQWQLLAERHISRFGNGLSLDKLLGHNFLKRMWVMWGVGEAACLSRAGQLNWSRGAKGDSHVEHGEPNKIIWWGKAEV